MGREEDASQARSKEGEELEALTTTWRASVGIDCCDAEDGRGGGV
jgi:hypothetical protein